jgi:hypothetical protein
MNNSASAKERVAALRAIRTRTRPYTTALIMLIATLQSAIYLTIIPPWHHYDEPTHFEYAWLLAHRPGLPKPDDLDALMRREVAASLREHRLYDNLRLDPSPLVSDRASAFKLGYSELHHSRYYYMLVSLPLAAARHLDVASQLLVARLVSAIMFLLTIRIAIGIMADLTPPEHPLRVAVPAILALLPPFVDAMTAVNNDAGAVLFFSLFLWGSVRMIRAGLTWRRAAWVLLAAGLAAMMKTTGLVALILAPLGIMVAFWLERSIAWWRLSAAALVMAAVALLAMLQWNEPASWYRDPLVGAGQPAPGLRQPQPPAAPVGSHVLGLTTSSGDESKPLYGPIADTAALAGKVVTIGCWIWSDQPAEIAAPGLVALNNRAVGNTMATAIQVTPTPQFVSWAITLPAELLPISFVLDTRILTPTQATNQLFLDGIVVTPGRFPAQPPQFSDGQARAGSWGGQPFTNYIRNASFERTRLSLRPWIDRMLLPYTGRHPAAVLFDLLDLERSPAIISQTIERQSMTFFVFFGWVQFRPPGAHWFGIIAVVVRVALLGCLVWLVRHWRMRDRRCWAALIFLGVAALPVWLFSVVRVLPFFMNNMYFPIARYGFPAIIPALLAVAAGWYALAPRRWQPAVVSGLVIAAATLNFLAIIGVVRLIRA